MGEHGSLRSARGAAGVEQSHQIVLVRIIVGQDSCLVRGSPVHQTLRALPCPGKNNMLQSGCTGADLRDQSSEPLIYEQHRTARIIERVNDFVHMPARVQGHDQYLGAGG